MINDIIYTIIITLVCIYYVIRNIRELKGPFLKFLFQYQKINDETLDNLIQNQKNNLNLTENQKQEQKIDSINNKSYINLQQISNQSKQYQNKNFITLLTPLVDHNINSKVNQLPKQNENLKFYDCDIPKSLSDLKCSIFKQDTPQKKIQTPTEQIKTNENQEKSLNKELQQQQINLFQNLSEQTQKIEEQKKNVQPKLKAKENSIQLQQIDECQASLEQSSKPEEQKKNLQPEQLDKHKTTLQPIQQDKNKKIDNQVKEKENSQIIPIKAQQKIEVQPSNNQQISTNPAHINQNSELYRYVKFYRQLKQKYDPILVNVQDKKNQNQIKDKKGKTYLETIQSIRQNCMRPNFEVIYQESIDFQKISQNQHNLTIQNALFYAKQNDDQDLYLFLVYYIIWYIEFERIVNFDCPKANYYVALIKDEHKEANFVKSLTFSFLVTIFTHKQNQAIYDGFLGMLLDKMEFLNLDNTKDDQTTLAYKTISKLVPPNMVKTEDGANKSSNKLEIVNILLLGVIELDLYNIYRNIYNYPVQNYNTKKQFYCQCNGQPVNREDLYFCKNCNSTKPSEVLGRKSQVFIAFLNQLFSQEINFFTLICYYYVLELSFDMILNIHYKQSQIDQKFLDLIVKFYDEKLKNLNIDDLKQKTKIIEHSNKCNHFYKKIVIKIKLLTEKKYVEYIKDPDNNIFKDHSNQNNIEDCDYEN